MTSSERTPLLQSVSTTPARARYPHKWLRMTCTIVSVVGMLLFAILIITDAIPSSFHNGGNTAGLSDHDLYKILLDTPNREHLRTTSRYYTSGPHLAGQNYSQALWTRDQWRTAGIASEIVAYDVYLNYPGHHRLALLAGLEKEVKYECQLEEDVLDDDPTSRLEDRIPIFHGYGASGNVTAPYVYVNFGTYEDFEDLRKANVTLAGNIALAKYGRNFRGLKVKRAQELGMLGVVMYSDPQEDGNITEANGYAAYPHGPARQASSVQRGSAQYISILPGDPTTPGYASKPGVPRVDPASSTPRIPSIPLSYREAIPLLQGLNGHGPVADGLGKYWQGGGLSHEGITYHIGPSPAGLQLNLVAQHDYKTTPIWNVIGTIEGERDDEVVVVGNHRDAWVAGGAGDPNSGSASLNEMVRGFGKALQAGWTPTRSIIFASWDGEEYGLLGSTEWVEDHMPWLKETAVAYLNVDVGAVGSVFHAAASPLLNQVLRHVTTLVDAPNESRSVADMWDGRISTIGSGSDFTAFQDFAGIPSLDMGFGPGPDAAVYHYHSNYDSATWMDKYGDPGWHSHVVITQLWGLLTAALATPSILDMNVTEYTQSLHEYVKTAQDRYQAALIPDHISFDKLLDVVETLTETAQNFEADIRPEQDAKKINQIYKKFEKTFLHPDGLEGREQFKHVIFAPGIWTGYSGSTLPGIVEGIDAKDNDRIQKWIDIVIECVSAATRLLKTGNVNSG